MIGDNLGPAQVAAIVVLVQRGLEEIYSRRNMARLLAEGGVERDADYYRVVAAAQLGWLASVAFLIPREAAIVWPALAAYLLLQVARYWVIAALEQGIGLGYQVDSSPLTVDGIKITNVDGESCGTCNIAQALKQSLNTSYYRLMLKLKGGPQAVADAAHQAGVATSFPGVEHTLSEDGKGRPPNNGVVLGQYQTRVFDMASAYATLAASGVYHRPHFVQKVVNSDGQVLFDAANSDNKTEERIPKAVADNTTAELAVM